MKFLEITSSHNPRFRAALRLRHAHHRTREGKFVIDGSREIERAIQAGVEILEWYLPSATDAALIARRYSTANGLWMTLLPSLYEQLAYGERNVDIIAVAKIPDAPELPSLPTNPLLAVVEGIEKPGNLGAMLRTGCAAGVDAFVVTDRVTDLFNPNVIRASTGAVFTVPTLSLMAGATIDWLHSLGIQILAVRVDASLPYFACDLQRPTALVLGSEAHGLSAAWNHSAVVPIHIPMNGVVDSLNVSVTAAILFYEARRQRSVRTAPPTT